ncbi:MAG: hypothetical protein KAJ44_00610 [Thermoplasmatales archaeon]|nr:hypothetical protein [Thermoplasmatales archaeon]
MKYVVKSFKKNIQKTKFSSYVMGVDIGSTNTKFGVAGVNNNRPTLIFSLNFKNEV